ncbi:MAG: hypothetical protein HETSPECPRED_000786 [Heterodermia speciosa]|uniref:tRNA pseudouridine(55) synthase n=1 Tax=Heterodermia speciosa TaxID=116794 RepID=A0A8H3G8L4_9LECA|nr:MAG: hypothetical protein HETSPECPRED_000786 [Heterodermia speciosa]
MSTSTLSEGVFAINKPKSVSSAQTLRDLQKAFNSSKFFASWLSAEKVNRSIKSFGERRRRKKPVEVKLGHGGTLDPMATGVLIVGVGKGTKSLQNYLSCTKTYEATILFGAATDSYDTLGKILNKAPYAHITRERVEEALEKFRGKIMQRPPLYSALHVQGKRLYEYAREGKEVPVEIQERPVEVQELRIVEWLEGGSHQYKWPSQEAETEDKEPAEVVLHLQDIPGTSTETCKKQSENEDHSRKRRRTVDEEEDVVAASVPTRKSQQVEKTFCMSGGLQEPDPEGTENAKSEDPVSISQGLSSSEEQPPAVRLRMTVTSGFYVRSLAHDLGKAVDSLGCMSDLIRTTQENFQLGRNVLEWSDIKGGEEVWASKLETMLQDWQDRIEEPGDHEKPEPIPQSAIV